MTMRQASSAQRYKYCGEPRRACIISQQRMLNTSAHDDRFVLERLRAIVASRHIMLLEEEFSREIEPLLAQPQTASMETMHS